MSTPTVDQSSNLAYIRLSEITQVCSSYKLFPVESRKKYYYKTYQMILQENQSDYSTILRTILQDGGDINYKIPANSIVRLHRPNILGYTALHFAVESFNLPALNTLLKLGADFTIKNYNSFSALRLALTKSYVKNVDLLQLQGSTVHPVINLLLDTQVKANNSINVKDNDGVSHFHIACIVNNVKAVEFFLKNGVPTNEYVNVSAKLLPGYTPLHFAVRYCSFETIELLLQYNVCTDVSDANGMTPLHFLIKYAIDINYDLDIDDRQHYKQFQSDLEKTESAIKLLSYKANNDFTYVFDNTGLSYFHVACASTVSIKKSDLEKIKDIHTPIRFDSPFCPGYTPLHFAVHFSIENFILLIEHGADMQAKDANGVTPLDICLEKYDLSDIHPVFSSNKTLNNVNMSNGRNSLTDMIQILSDVSSLKSFLKSKSKADLNSYVNTTSPLWPGCTILHLAVNFAKTSRNSDIFEKVDHSQLTKSIEYFDKIDFECSLDEKVALCLRTGMDITLQDAKKRTPLHLAFKKQNRAIVNGILNEHRNIIANPFNSDNLSHFHIALCKGDDFIINFLRSGTDINSQTRSEIKWFKNSSTIVNIAAGSTALHMAVMLENIRMIDLLLNYDVDLSIKNYEGAAPIHVAFRENSKRIARILLLQPKALSENSTSDEGLSYFHVACFLKMLPTVEAFLKQGVDVNSSITLKRRCDKNSLESGLTPLHFAIRNLSFETVSLLVQNGANIHAKSESGFSPLYTALKIYMFGNVYENAGSKKLEKIVDCFYSVLKRDNPKYRDEVGLTMLHLACICVDEEMVKVLLKSGSNVNAQIDCNSFIFPGYTALHFLTKFGYHNDEWVDGYRIAKLLLNHGANVNLKNSNLDTPLHMSYACKSMNTKNACLKLLQICKNVDVKCVNREGFSHFHLACSAGDATVVERMLKTGVYVNHRTDWFKSFNPGFTPLHLAVDRHDQESIEITDILLKNGADVNSKDGRGMTPLHIAVHHTSSMNICKMKILLRYKPIDVNARNIYGNTPLSLFIRNNCCMTNEAEELTILLSRGALLNIYNPLDSEGVFGKVVEVGFNVIRFFRITLNHATDLDTLNKETGRDAIHNAVSIYSTKNLEDAYLSTFTKLLRKGCTLDRQDFQGKTALHLAAKFYNSSAVKALIKLGSDINIRDNQGNVPISYCAKESSKHSDAAAKELAWHIRRLLLVGIDVSDANKYYCNKILWDVGPIGYAKQDLPYLDELAVMKNKQIFENSFSLRDFMREETVADYPTMPRVKRDAIKKFHYHNLPRIKTKFRSLGYIFCLQYKSIMERTSLMAPAKSALGLLAGRDLPDPCSEHIMQFISNFDLKTLISVNVNVQNDGKRRKIENL